MYQKKYVDSEVWEEITESEAIEFISRYYNNINDVLYAMQQEPGSIVRTPWAFYKWVDNNADLPPLS